MMALTLTVAIVTVIVMVVVLTAMGGGGGAGGALVDALTVVGHSTMVGTAVMANGDCDGDFSGPRAQKKTAYAHTSSPKTNT